MQAEMLLLLLLLLVMTVAAVAAVAAAAVMTAADPGQLTQHCGAVHIEMPLLLLLLLLQILGEFLNTVVQALVAGAFVTYMPNTIFWLGAVVTGRVRFRVDR
jgi:prepilin signal peptidase PulO-like enzyme (type II secretory pathway)